jgi:hypothetical protein
MARTKCFTLHTVPLGRRRSTLALVQCERHDTARSIRVRATAEALRASGQREARRCARRSPVSPLAPLLLDATAGTASVRVLAPSVETAALLLRKRFLATEKRGIDVHDCSSTARVGGRVCAAADDAILEDADAPAASVAMVLYSLEWMENVRSVSSADSIRTTTSTKKKTNGAAT